MAALAAVVMAAPATAVVVPNTPAVFDSVGDTFSIDFSQGYDDGRPLAGLTAEAIFTLSSLGDGTQWTFNIERLANTSGGLVTKSRLVGFGFDVAPDVKSVSSIGRFQTVKGDSITNGLKIEVYFSEKGVSCAGGGGLGLWGGSAVANEFIASPSVNSTDTFTLTFGAVQTLVTLNNFVVRYQDVQAPDADFKPSGSGVGTAGIVPEPAAWAMLIAGFGLVGGAMRRRRYQPAVPA